MASGGSLMTGAVPIEDLPASVKDEMVVRRHKCEHDRQRRAESLVTHLMYSYHVARVLDLVFAKVASTQRSRSSTATEP